MKIISEWDKDSRTTTCIISDKNNNIFVGTATCHPEDKDMCNKLTGQQIAFLRCRIKLLQFYKNKYINELKGIEKTFQALQCYKIYNQEHFESKFLQKTINQYKQDINDLKKLIINEKTELKNYINEKDKLYQTIRGNKQNNNKNYKCLKNTDDYT